MLAATDPPGPGLDPDAVSYLGAAESLVAGHGYQIPTAEWASPDSTQPLAHFPPGFSTLLAIPIALGAQPIQGARFIEATAAFVTTTVLVLLVSSVTNTITAALLAFALFAMTSMHEVHISVLSEPVYIACSVFTLAAMVWWPERPLRAGIPAAIAAITRYAGVSLVGAVALWAFTRSGSWRQRITRAVISVVPAALLQILWVLRTEEAHDAEEIRRFAIYGDLGTTLHQGLSTLTAWLVPDPSSTHDLQFRGFIACAAALVLIAIVFMGYMWLRWLINISHCRPEQREGPALHDAARRLYALLLLRACGLVATCYLGLVLTSRVFADPLIPLDERMLSPALVVVMIMIAITTSTWWRCTRRVAARVAVAVVLLVWWISSAGATRLEARYALDWGSDFAGYQWRTSELVAWTRKNAATTPLYTNWPAAVYYYLHRTSHKLPKSADAKTLAEFGATLRARHAVVLLFNAPNGEYIPSDSLFNVPGLELKLELRDGVVLAPVPARP